MDCKVHRWQPFMAALESIGVMPSFHLARVAALVAVCAFVHVDRVAAAAPEPSGASESLRGYLESQGSPAFASDDRGAELWRVVRAFYEQRQYAPAWIDAGGGLTPGSRALLRAIAAAGREGLPTGRYDP